MSLPVFLWKSLPKSGKSGEKGRETRPPPVGNLYPNSGKPGKRVENPALTVRKSLPKQRKSGEKVENPRSRRSEISTQTAEIGRKGRESHSCRLEISTQTAKMCKKGREFQACGLEISTRMVNNTLSTQFLFCKIVKDKTFISVKLHSDTPFIYK